MTVPSFHVEAKLHAFRRTQEGVVVSFVVSPIDMPSQLATDPLGTRYMVALAQIGDDEQPISPVAPIPGSAALASADDAGRPPQNKPASATGETRKEYTLANRVGMTCAEPKFQEWLSRRYPGTTVNKDTVGPLVRHICGVETRADILPGTPAATKWHALALDYEQATGRLAEERR